MWAKTVRDKWMPLDAEPFKSWEVPPHGSWGVYEDSLGEMRLTKPVGPDVYLSHHATCPAKYSVGRRIGSKAISYRLTRYSNGKLVVDALVDIYQ